MGERCVMVTISGRVQGVGFRAWTQREALARGLSGYVRNCRDGSVEAVFSGEADAVEAMIAAARGGPIGARVDAVDIKDHAEDMKGAFRLLPTL